MEWRWHIDENQSPREDFVIDERYHPAAWHLSLHSLAIDRQERKPCNCTPPPEATCEDTATDHLHEDPPTAYYRLVGQVCWLNGSYTAVLVFVSNKHDTRNHGDASLCKQQTQCFKNGKNSLNKKCSASENMVMIVLVNKKRHLLIHKLTPGTCWPVNTFRFKSSALGSREGRHW